MNFSHFFQAAFYICLVAILFLATTTTVHIELVESMWDKANHFTAFFVLYILLSFGYKSLRVWHKVVVLVGYGVFIEILQSFLPPRSASLFDILADCIGIGIGVVVVYMILFYKRKMELE
jgi:VanZ family protein